MEPTIPQNPFRPPGTNPVSVAAAPVTGPKQSGPGVASFVLAMISGLVGFALVVTAGVMEGSTPGGIDETSSIAIILGLGLFAVVGLSLCGIGLGIAGLIQANRLRIFAILGLLFNGFVVLGLVGLMVIGMSMAPAP